MASSKKSKQFGEYSITWDALSCHISLKVLMIEGGEEEKRGILTDFIVKMDPSDKVMVFVGKKSRADDISSDLSLQGKGIWGKNI